MTHEQQRKILTDAIGQIAQHENSVSAIATLLIEAAATHLIFHVDLEKAIAERRAS